MGKIEIERTKQYANKARRIGIYINNIKVGTINDGETKSFNVNSVANEIYAKIDWCKTKPLKINIEKDEIVKIELGSNSSGWKLLLIIYYITLNTSEYLYLKQKN